jgi:hypothetical protein
VQSIAYLIYSRTGFNSPPVFLFNRNQKMHIFGFNCNFQRTITCFTKLQTTITIYKTCKPFTKSLVCLWAYLLFFFISSLLWFCSAFAQKADCACLWLNRRIYSSVNSLGACSAKAVRFCAFAEDRMHLKSRVEIKQAHFKLIYCANKQAYGLWGSY